MEDAETPVDSLDHWSLVASGVAGTALEVREGDHPVAWTDGEVIYIPPGIEALVPVIVQAAIVGAGSLDRRVTGHLRARGAASRRYLLLEAIRAVDARASVVPPKVSSVVRSLWDGPVSASADESLQRSAGREDVPEAPPELGCIRPARIRSGERVAGGTPGALDQRAQTDFLETPEMDDDEEESESINFMRALTTPVNVFGDNPLMRWMKKNLGVGTREDPDGGSGGAPEMQAGGAAWGEEPGADARPVEAVAPGVHQRVPDGPPGHFRYPEWDHVAAAYRPSHCSVREVDPRPGTDPVRPGTDLALRREVARLGLDYERHRRQLEGPDLDLTAVVDFTVSRARDEQPDDRIYQVRQKTARDLAVLVLLDASGSTGDHRASGTTVFDDERQVVANLVHVLEEMGDRVGAFAFNSRGAAMTRFLRIKEFDGRMDDGALARLAGIKPSAYTRLGVAIRHATRTLVTVGGASNRLLVVVSDGLPYDDGYESAHAEHDTRRSIEEAVAEGVACLCVSVGSQRDDDALAALWGAASHVRLLDPSDLGVVVGPLLRSSLAVAARRGDAPP